MRKIVIKIHKGEVTVKPEGYPGHKCKDVTKAMENALGVVKTDTPTAEMYQEEQNEFLTENN